MDIKKLDRANLLRERIVELDVIIEGFKKAREIKITSGNANPFEESPYICLKDLRKEEIINLLKSWKDEYQKEFEEL